MVRDTVGTDVSHALGEVRTVHSRANTALKALQRGWTRDPDSGEMLRDLQAVVDLLDKYKKTGKTKAQPKMPRY